MIKTVSSERHDRRHLIMIGHKDLELLVAHAAAKQVENVKLDTDRAGITYNVKFEEATEGSPPYRVGFQAVVEIVEDLLPHIQEARQ